MNGNEAISRPGPGARRSTRRYAARAAAFAAVLALAVVSGCTRTVPPAPSTLAEAHAAYDPVFARVRDQLASEMGWTWTVSAPADTQSWGNGTCYFATDLLLSRSGVLSPDSMQRIWDSVDKALAGTGFDNVTHSLGGVGGWSTLVAVDGAGARLDLAIKDYATLSLALKLDPSACGTPTTR